MKTTCSTCKYWNGTGNMMERRDPGDVVEGDCRYNPPTLFVIPGQSMLGEMQIQLVPMVPRTRSDFWCGKHETELARG